MSGIALEVSARASSLAAQSSLEPTRQQARIRRTPPTSPSNGAAVQGHPQKKKQQGGAVQRLQFVSAEYADDVDPEEEEEEEEEDVDDGIISSSAGASELRLPQHLHDIGSNRNSSSTSHPTGMAPLGSSSRDRGKLASGQEEPAVAVVDENGILGWENPSYLVKDLDTGESYHVDEIGQQFHLVTLDAVVTKTNTPPQHQHEQQQHQQQQQQQHKQQHRSSRVSEEDAASVTAPSESVESSSSYLLSLYTADETADIEFDDEADTLSRTRCGHLSLASDDAWDTDPMRCQFGGCAVMHQRQSGFCPDHEIIAREEEDLRAQALYLIPMGARAEFVGISGHGFVYDTASRLYTVYVLEMRCTASNASWHIYRRYQEFRALHDCLRALAMRVPTLPPKKLIGSFEPEFITKRQSELAEWLRLLLTQDQQSRRHQHQHQQQHQQHQQSSSSSSAAAYHHHRQQKQHLYGNDDTALITDALNPHLCDEVRKFLTARADQPPFLLERLPLKRSSFFGASLTGDDFDDDYDSSEDEAMDASSSTRTKKTRPRKKKKARRLTLQDFKMLQVIGRGSFGKVVLVAQKNSSKLFAMKILSKENIVKRKQVEHTRTERRVLGFTNHPFIVGLHCAFQTPQRLYFVLDYCPGGELFYHLSRMKKLPEHMACFYAAEITLALEHLHSLGVVYRDLKPENILLTKDGHIMLADFGLAKEGIHDSVQGTNSLCGTPEYLPPEILDRVGHGTAVDWWNLGMVLYEMLTGLPPWYTNDRKKLFERLRSARLHFPPYVSRRAESLIRQLLTRNPRERLGARGAHQLKRHVFFENVDWDKLLKKQVAPPFRPCHTAMNDGEAPLNFEAEFTRLPLPSDEGLDHEDGLLQSHPDGYGANGGGSSARLTGRYGRYGQSDSDTFRGFSYENPELLAAALAEAEP